MVDVMVKIRVKQTEVGLIPDDWNLVSYNDAFDFLNTATYSRAQLSDNEKIGYVHYGDVHTKHSHFLDLDVINLPTIKRNLQKNYQTIKDGDLIVVDASEDYKGIGKSVEVRNVKNRKAISGLHTFLLRGKDGLIEDGYKAYIYYNKLVKKQMDTLATGLKVYGVSKANLKKILIPLPPTKAEQIAIATTLNDIDALITGLEKLIIKKGTIRQGAMQELLTGKKRVGGFHDKWVEETLPNVCWFQEGPGLRNWQFTKFGIKVINVTNLENGYINLDKTQRYISLEEFHKMYEHFEIDENDIVVASSGNSYGKVAVARRQDLPLLMNTSVIRFKPLRDFHYKFLLLFLKSNLFKNQLDLLTTGGAQPNFGPAHLKKTVIMRPKTIDEQIYIAQILSDMDAEIEMLKEKLNKHKTIKQGMMQSLLTGKTRLV
jgi:type I restriction enzyme S subunit